MSNTIIKKEFVRRILQDEANEFKENQGLALRQFLNFHTGKTESERTFIVSADDSMDGKLTIKMKAHIRFLDIKKKTTADDGSRINRKNRPIYNRFAYGHYFSIASRLMYDLTDDVVESIKKDLNQ